MQDLQSEVSDEITDFIQTAEDMRSKTSKRQMQLTKIKSEYKKLQKEKTHLKLAALK